MNADITPDEVRALRRSLDLSSAQCARLVGLADGKAWQRFEQDGPHRRAISVATLSLFLWRTQWLPGIFAAIANRTKDKALRKDLLAAAQAAKRGASPADLVRTLHP